MDMTDTLAPAHSHTGGLDELTGLADRRHFYASVDAVAASGRAWSVLLVDLDRFRQVNERHGYLVGDAVLHTIADRLRECAASRDTVARVGGDEFALVVSWDGTPNLAELALEVIGAVEAPIPVDGGCVEVGCTLGIGAAAAGDPAITVLHTADRDRAIRKAYRRDAHVTTLH